VSNHIDNVVGENNIADHWAHIYTKDFQLNSESMKRDDLNFQESLRNMSSDKQNLNVLSTDDVKNAIRKIGNKKSAWPDNIKIEHIKNAPFQVVLLLTLFFNLCISHSFLPKSMMLVTLYLFIRKKEAQPAAKFLDQLHLQM